MESWAQEALLSLSCPSLSCPLTDAEANLMKRQKETAHRESNGDGFRAFGRTYGSERAAVVSLIDKICAGEANAAHAFGAWADQCTTPSLRSALRMVAERETSHARVFERRMRDLGAERRAGATADGEHLRAYLSD